MTDKSPSYTVNWDRVREGWGVFRTSWGGNSSWHINVSYKDKALADEVADFLTTHGAGETSLG